MIARGERLTVELASIAMGGDAVARVDGMAVFVDGGVPGDVAMVEIVEARDRFARARLVEIVTPSPRAVPPGCEVADACGGCRFWRMPYEEEVATKARGVVDTLRRIGGIADVPAPSVVAGPSPDGYRERARFRVDVDGQLGFYGARSHAVVRATGCRILHPGIAAALPTLSALFGRLDGVAAVFAEWDAVREGVCATGELAARDMPSVHRTLRARLDRVRPLDALTSVVLRHGEAQRAVMGDGLVHRERPAGDRSIVVRERAGGFSQAHGALNASLQRAVLDAAGPPRSANASAPLLELFCGAGNLTLPLLGAGWDVDAVDVADPAVRAGAAAWRASDERRQRGRFLAGDLERGLPTEVAAAARRYDVVVADPPRAGLAAQLLRAVVGLVPRRIVYVACDAPALARDAARFRGHGYALRALTVLDMFPRTPHVEVVATFEAHA